MTIARDPRWSTVFDAVTAENDNADALDLTRPSAHRVTAAVIEALQHAETHAAAPKVRPAPPLLTWRDLGLDPTDHPDGPAADAVRILDVTVASLLDKPGSKTVQIRAASPGDPDFIQGAYDVHGPGRLAPGDPVDASVTHLAVAVRAARKILTADAARDAAIADAYDAARAARAAAGRTATDEVFAEIDRGDRR